MAKISNTSAYPNITVIDSNDYLILTDAENDLMTKSCKISTLSNFIIDGGVHIREINQILKINLVSKEAKTINGFILEHIENLPNINDIISIQGHTFKILENLDNAVKTVHLEINNE